MINSQTVNRIQASAEVKCEELIDMIIDKLECAGICSNAIVCELRGCSLERIEEVLNDLPDHIEAVLDSMFPTAGYGAKPDHVEQKLTFVT